jgi:hypothetical protein
MTTDAVRRAWWSLLNITNRSKEKKMEDTQAVETKSLVLTFTGGDYKPKRLASGLIGFRAPFDITLKNGQSQSVDLQMVCSYPLLLVSAHQTNPTLLQPQGKIVVEIKNDHGEDLVFKAGDVIARAYPLLPVDYVIG